MKTYILRCRPQKTLDFMRWATEAHPGQFWTPVLVRMKRLPRRRKIIQVQYFALPGYLFMHETAAGGPMFKTLARKGATPIVVPPSKYAMCDVEELLDLRQRLEDLEQASKRGEPEAEVAPRFSPGEVVRVVSGPISGTEGQVIGQTGDLVTISTPSFWGKLKISSFLLQAAAPI